jgi:ribosomal protein S27AE
VEKVQQSCPYCNHTELLDGKLQTSGLVYFRPTKTKFWTFKDGNVNVRSLMCTRCGGLFCIGDVAKLNSLKVTEEEPETKAKPSAADAK